MTKNYPQHTAIAISHQIDHRRVVGNTLLCIETNEHHTETMIRVT